jgi:hypothetical protein
VRGWTADTPEEALETPELCLARELGEEWPGVRILRARPLPLLEGSSVPPGPSGLFLMRPFRIATTYHLPDRTSDGVPLGWVDIYDALRSPVPQVRMMVAAAMYDGDATDWGFPP